jgi:hypothetical protein
LACPFLAIAQFRVNLPLENSAIENGRLSGQRIPTTIASARNPSNQRSPKFPKQSETNRKLPGGQRNRSEETASVDYLKASQKAGEFFLIDGVVGTFTRISGVDDPLSAVAQTLSGSS